MITPGKRLSSAAAVACVWVAGSVLAQLLYLVAASSFLLAHAQGEPAGDAPHDTWLLIPFPLVVVLGGVGGIWLLRQVADWPTLSLPKLFACTLGVAVVGLALVALPSHRLRSFSMPLVTNFLAVAMTAVLTWRAAGAGSLGTHLFPGSTRSKGPEGTDDPGGRPPDDA